MKEQREQYNDIISKLNKLSLIEPSKAWISAERNKILSKAPISNWDVFELEKKNYGLHSLNKKSRSYNNNVIPNNLFLTQKKLAFALTAIIIVSFGCIFTVNASKSSLPGEFLYPVKIAKEELILTVSPDEEKAKIEIEQAGRRLEELNEISKKLSDIKQREKIEELVSSFEKKVNNANKHLSNANRLADKNVKTDVAKVVNSQSGKYTEVLAKTIENLPDTVKKKVSEKAAKAIVSAEKVKINALLVMAKESEKDNAADVVNSDEIKAKIEEEINKKNDEIEKIEKISSVSVFKQNQNNNESDSDISLMSIDSSKNTNGADSKADNKKVLKENNDKLKDDNNNQDKKCNEDICNAADITYGKTSDIKSEIKKDDVVIYDCKESAVVSANSDDKSKNNELKSNVDIDNSEYLAVDSKKCKKDIDNSNVFDYSLSEAANKAKEKLEKAKEDVSNENFIEAIQNVVAAGEITEKAKISFEILPVPANDYKKATENKEKPKE